MSLEPEYRSDTKLAILDLSPVLIPYFLGFFIFRGFFNNFPIYIQIKQNLSDVETVEIWALISGFALLVGALTRLPAGLISDKIGRLKAFGLGYIFHLSAMLLILFVSNTFWYVIAMSMVRFGLNSFAMTGRSIVSNATRDRGFKNGLLSSMVGLGSFVGPFSLAYVLDHYKPDVIVYVTIGVILLDFILFVLIYYLIRSYFDKSDSEIDLELSAVDKEHQSFDRMKQGLLRPGIPESFFLFFSAGMIFGLITQVYTIYGYNIVGMRITVLGFITGSGAIVQAIWAPIVGKLYAYVKDEYMRLFAWFILLFTSVMMVLAPYGRFFFVSGYYLLNLGNSSYFTMEITRMGRVTKQGEFSFIFGIATSLIILATSVAGFISQILYNIIPEGTYYTALIFAIISLVVVISSARRNKMEGDEMDNKR